MSHPACSTPAPPDHDGHFVMIPLTHGKFAVVDEGDAELVLSLGNWYAMASRSNWYAARRRAGGGATIYMHKLITGYSMTDHANRNGLDNRRINLRPATFSQNSANRPPLRHSTSGYKGLCWNWRARKWIVQIHVNGQVTYLGSFTDPVEGARAYNAAAAAAWGEFACLNPLPEPGESVQRPSRPEPLDERVIVDRIARALMEHPDACHWDRYIAWRAAIPAREMHATFRRMLKDGWISLEPKPGKTTGKYYRVTETGKAELATLLESA